MTTVRNKKEDIPIDPEDIYMIVRGYYEYTRWYGQIPWKTKSV